MKKRNLLLIVLILLTLVIFMGYRALMDLQSDTKPPVIRLDSIVPEVSVKDPRSALLQGITASDNADGDVTDSLVVEYVELLDGEGSLMISYAAFDNAGNVAKAQRQAKYTDYVNPKFTLNGPLVYNYGSNFDLLSNVGARDVIDGDIQHRVRATALVNHSIGELGIHDVEFQVTNSLGDRVTVVLPVQVQDDEYEAYLGLKTYLTYLPLNSSFNPREYLKEYILRDEEVDLTKGLPQGYTLETEGKVQVNKPGVYPVEYWVTYIIENERDPELNVEYTGYSKLFVIVEG